MSLRILAGWDLPKEQGVVLVIGFVIIVIIILAGTTYIVVEIFKSLKMYVKGSKMVRQDMLKRSGIILAIILIIIALTNIGRRF